MKHLYKLSTSQASLIFLTLTIHCCRLGIDYKKLHTPLAPLKQLYYAMGKKAHLILFAGLDKR